jgi:hypothetical protein
LYRSLFLLMPESYSQKKNSSTHEGVGPPGRMPNTAQWARRQNATTTSIS